MNRLLLSITFVLVSLPVLLSGGVETGDPLYISDIKIATGSNLVLAESGTRKVVLADLNGKAIREWTFKEPVTGIAVENRLVYVTGSGNRGWIALLDLDKSRIIKEVEVGLGARSPVIGPDKKSVYLAARFEGVIYRMDSKTLKVQGKAKVLREPFSMTVSSDGKYLFVNNFLPAQRADADVVAAGVSVIELSGFSKIKDISLSNGSNALKGICLSPDGNYLFVTHNLGRYQVPTSQLEQGWMNTAGLSIIDARKLELMATVILDEPEQGAAGSWGIACTGSKLLVAHSGTHDISVIDYPKFIGKLISEPNLPGLSYNLGFLEGIRKRYPIPGNGPRTFAVMGNLAYIPTYFSDDLIRFDFNSGTYTDIDLNPGRVERDEDKGQRIFNDATYCFQGWQSCNGCHPDEGRPDALNWDLLNDGIGNPKNCKSLLFSHLTPPVMISGIRASAEVAVRSGFKHIQFNAIPEEEANLVDTYLKSLKPLPSPWLVNGKLSETAKKGKVIFERVGCAECHNGEYFTDGQLHKIGEADPLMKDWKGWDTPTLREVWRTAPYLFNGSAARMSDVFVVNRHGLNKALTPGEVEQLVDYLNSL